MTEEQIRGQYFDWRLGLIGEIYHGREYMNLLRHLDTIPFTYTQPRDGDREADGIDFRYRFGYEQHYDSRVIASCLDNRPCSVLEMMVALAFRCEEQIMADAEYGNRTGQWFWAMIESLDLLDMYDEQFDAQHVDAVVDRFLDRRFSWNGEGGLFTVRNPRRDMRSTEIWYQMCYYLNDISEAS